jgi:hypothetical protein
MISVFPRCLYASHIGSVFGPGESRNLRWIPGPPASHLRRLYCPMSNEKVRSGPCCQSPLSIGLLESSEVGGVYISEEQRARSAAQTSCQEMKEHSLFIKPLLAKGEALLIQPA